jgi:hypothetical protein
MKVIFVKCTIKTSDKLYISEQPETPPILFSREDYIFHLQLIFFKFLCALIDQSYDVSLTVALVLDQQFIFALLLFMTDFIPGMDEQTDRQRDRERQRETERDRERQREKKRDRKGQKGQRQRRRKTIHLCSSSLSDGLHPRYVCTVFTHQQTQRDGKMNRQRGRETERDRERQRETERETERDRETQRETERHRERQREKERDSERQKRTDREMEKDRPGQTE